ncbi:MAG TPA: phosphotransferase family protein [Acidimicrobiales bacterium]
MTEPSEATGTTDREADDGDRAGRADDADAALVAAAVPAEPLRRWLADHVPHAGDGPLRVTKLAGGRSNLTFRLQDGRHDWVLRRPPLGPLLATAHDVGREARVQAALAATDVPVPRIVAACDDPDVIGAPFYVMGHLDGVVYADADCVGHLTAAHARAASDELVDVLARLHAVDPAAVGLADFGRPAGFLERQVRRWRTQWERSTDREVPVVEEVATRLARALPPEQPPAIVHGDYSFNNTIWFRDRPGRMQAVLDWEMSTLGDPLTDLGMLLTYWGPVGEVMWRDRPPQPHRAGPGFPDADTLVERYGATSGRSLDHLAFYRVLATYKLAVIAEGAAARLAASGPDGAARAARTRGTTDHLAAMALDQARAAGL